MTGKSLSRTTINHFEARFQVRDEAEGWTIFDTEIDEFVTVNNRAQIGLTLEEAEELAYALNQIERRRRLTH